MTQITNHPSVLVVASGTPDSFGPGVVWIERYFDGWDKSKLFWWGPDFCGNVDGCDWISTSNVLLNRCSAILGKYTRKKSVLSVAEDIIMFWLRRFLRRKNVQIVVWIVELANWRYLRSYLENIDVPILIVVHDDLIEIARFFWKKDGIKREDYVKCLKAADEVAVISEEMRRYYSSVGIEKLNVFPPLAITRQCCNDRSDRAAESTNKVLSIGVIGTLYGASSGEDSFRVFLRKLDSTVRRYGYSVNMIFSRGCPLTIQDLSKSLEHIEFSLYDGLHEHDLLSLVKSFDAFFMNSSFSENVRELISTQFPSKLPYYLSFPKPILNVSPAYYPGSNFLKDKDFAINITDLSDTAIENAVKVLIDIKTGEKQISDTSYQTAYAEFDPTIHKQRWQALIKVRARS